MVVVDLSISIDFFCGTRSSGVRVLRELLQHVEVGIELRGMRAWHH